MRNSRLACVLGLFLAAACRTPRDSGESAALPAPAPPLGDRVLLVGGTIRIGAPQWSLAEALYAENGRIVAVGSEEQVRAQAIAPYRTIDLEGAVALPGMI